MEIAIAVARIERLDRHSDQEITFSGVAFPFAARRMTYAFGLVQGMRNSVCESGLLQGPLTIRSNNPRKSNKQQCDHQS